MNLTTLFKEREEAFDKTFQQDKTGEAVKGYLLAVPAFLYPKEEISATCVKIATPDDVKSFNRDTIRLTLEAVRDEIDGLRKEWKPTCGYESEEEKGFQKGIIAEQNLRNQTLTDLSSKIAEALERMV